MQKMRSNIYRKGDTKLSYPLKPSNKYTWDEIIEIISRGKISKDASSWDIDGIKYLNVGDTTSPVDLGTEGSIPFQIMGFKSFKIADNTKYACIDFLATICLKTKKQMHTSSTNVGGFDTTTLYTYLNDTIYNKFPEPIKSNIQEVERIANDGNSLTTSHTYKTKIWIPNESEILYSSTLESHFENDTLTACALGMYEDRKQLYGTSENTNYWTSSPHSGSGFEYILITDVGYNFPTSATTSCGILVGFSLCIDMSSSVLEYKPLDEYNSIADIKAVAEKCDMDITGRYMMDNGIKILKAGDITKPFNLGTEGLMPFQILGFKHDWTNLERRERSLISFMSVNCLKTQYPLGDRVYTVNNVNELSIYNVLNTTILNLFPDDIKSIIVDTYKLFHQETFDPFVTYSTKLWIPSYEELVNGSTSVSRSFGYRRYSGGLKCNKVKILNTTSTKTDWWLMSWAESTKWRLINTEGNLESFYMDNGRGIVIGFCV